MRWGLILTVLAAGLAGCTGFNARPFPAEVNIALQKEPQQPIPPVYCYNNLGHSPDCYEVPIEPEVRRLMGYDGPPPVNRGFFGRRAF